MNTDSLRPEPVLEIGSRRRLVMGAQTLRLEELRSGAWQTARAFPYAEVRVVYAYRIRSWRAIWAALVVWLLSHVMLGWLVVVDAIAEWRLVAVAVLLTLLIIGAAVYRILTVWHPQLRIDLHSGSLVVPNHHPEFFRQLVARLSQPDSVPDHSAAPERAEDRS